MTERKPKYENEKAPKAAKVDSTPKVTKAGKIEELSAVQWTMLHGTLNGKPIELNLEIAHIGAFVYLRFNSAECLYISDTGNPIVATTKGNWFDDQTGLTVGINVYEYRVTSKGSKAKTYKA